ncbi:unnamed protein product [Schistosoma curassoni]|uniref:Uncharacterized protein n=1 Tax=Schistosoma curassoni TaxID=6186 RepID=A0A3P8EJA6_9TREM|nr:unnamed protein product [Schistosoma curassoni]
MKELVLPGGFDTVSPSFTVRDVTAELSGPPLIRYSTSIGRIPSTTAFCEREQSSFQLKRKLGKHDGNRWDINYANHQTTSRDKP